MELLNYDEYFLAFSENAEILTEGVIDSIKNIINKIAELIRKFIASIKTLAGKIKDWFAALFKKDKKLMDKVDETIKEEKRGEVVLVNDPQYDKKVNDNGSDKHAKPGNAMNSMAHNIKKLDETIEKNKKQADDIERTLNGMFNDLDDGNKPSSNIKTYKVAGRSNQPSVREKTIKWYDFKDSDKQKALNNEYLKNTLDVSDIKKFMNMDVSKMDPDEVYDFFEDRAYYDDRYNKQRNTLPSSQASFIAKAYYFGKKYDVESAIRSLSEECDEIKLSKLPDLSEIKNRYLNCKKYDFNTIIINILKEYNELDRSLRNSITDLKSHTTRVERFGLTEEGHNTQIAKEFSKLRGIQDAIKYRTICVENYFEALATCLKFEINMYRAAMIALVGTAESLDN